MFKNILIPISSEFYTKDVLKRSIFLAEKFKSIINLIYIIEVINFLKNNEGRIFITPSELIKISKRDRNIFDIIAAKNMK